MEPEDYSVAVAVLISAPVLRTELIGPDPEVWLAFDKSFKPGDGVPAYHVSELAALRDKTPAQLWKINEVKKAFRGSTVRS